jgi:hypothetical protein
MPYRAELAKYRAAGVCRNKKSYPPQANSSNIFNPKMVDYALSAR